MDNFEKLQENHEASEQLREMAEFDRQEQDDRNYREWENNRIYGTSTRSKRQSRNIDEDFTQD